MEWEQINSIDVSLGDKHVVDVLTLFYESTDFRLSSLDVVESER